MRLSTRGNILGFCLLLVACSPETDLDSERTPTTDAAGSDGNISGSTASSQSGKLMEPPSASVEIATNLAGLVLAFPEAVVAMGGDAAVYLQPSGAASPVPLQLGSEIPCSAKCYVFAVTAELAPTMTYAVKVPNLALQFLDGKPVAAGDAGSFTTGAGPDVFAPRIQAFALDVAEGCASVHLAGDEQIGARAVITSNGVETGFASWAVGLTVDLVQRLPELPADPHAQATAYVADRSGNQAVSLPLAFALPPPVLPVVITEVLANPAGSENTQELVEIYNRGAVAVALGGWSLADKTGKDVLPEATLLPGAYALIVADSYNPADGKDPAPAEGTLLLRVPGRLGSDGLSNSGEPVSLLGIDGQVVSKYGGWVDTSASAWSGKSTKRVSVDACDAHDAWSKTPSAPTPGW